MIHRGRGLHRQRGYTIIEVSIVLAITAVLFGSAVSLFQGQQGKTIFSQSLYTLASQIQGYASQVNSGVYPNRQAYDCGISGSRPYLIAGAPSGNGNCLYLGRALQLIPNGNVMAAYTVLGTRTVGGAANGNIVEQFDQANPTPAFNLGGTTWYLTDTYNLPTGQTFTASKVYNQAGGLAANRYLVGFYTDLAGNSTNALTVRGYNFQGATTNSTAVKNCIEQTGVCSTASYTTVRTWEVCVKNGSHTGSVTVNATPSGVSTSVNALGCP